MNNKRIIEFFKEFYWIVPFLLFLLGYQSFNFLFKTHIIPAPNLIGKTVAQGLEVLSPSKLNMRMVTTKEDPDLPAGTILTQIPSPGKAIKPQQTLFVVISKKPQTIPTPEVKGLFKKYIVKMLREKNIRFTSFNLEVPQPEDLCIGQIPELNEPLPEGSMTLYFAKDTSRHVLIPDFTGIHLDEVVQFLNKYEIKTTVFHLANTSAKHTCKNCIVQGQKPLAGTLIDLKKSLSVQLTV